MPIPNVSNFSLQDVIDEIAGVQTSLAGCFTDADPDGFNPTYEGSKDRLSNFRDYDDNPASLTISPTSITVNPTGGSTTSVTVTTSGSPAWTQSNNSGGWLTTSPGSGTGNGTITGFASGNTSGSSRFATMTVVWSGTNRLATYVQGPS